MSAAVFVAAIGHRRYACENPGVWDKAPASDPYPEWMTADESRRSEMSLKGIAEIPSTNHATFSQERKLQKPAPKASFTRVRADFYPLAKEKTLKSMPASSTDSV